MAELTFLNPWHKIGSSPLLMAKHVSLGESHSTEKRKVEGGRSQASYKVIEPVQITSIVNLNLHLKMFPATTAKSCKIAILWLQMKHLIAFYWLILEHIYLKFKTQLRSQYIELFIRGGGLIGRRGDLDSEFSHISVPRTSSSLTSSKKRSLVIDNCYQLVSQKLESF